MSDASPRPHGKDERIRLLEYQAEFLRRELTLVTRRYDAIRWSAAWTLARPVKGIEDALHRLVLRLRRPAKSAAVTPPSALRAESVSASADVVAAIAARIAAKMERPPAGV